MTDIIHVSENEDHIVDQSSGAKNELDILLERENDLKTRISALKAEIEELEKEMNIQSESTKKDDKVEEAEEFYAPTYCVPIKANVMDFEWSTLAKACQFDVILMDPPWQLASQAPTRGVAIAYQQLPDICIESLPIQTLQNEGGFLFIWVINNKFNKALQLFTLWGYRFVDEISWVKQTVNRRMAKGHGYYLQHAKETCLVGVKLKSSVMPEFASNSEKRISHPIFSQFYSSNNTDSANYARDDDEEYQDVLEPKNVQYCIGSDTIFSERRGQSQKPEELYEMIEQLVPGGTYLEIFGRKNNLRDYWVTVGNEL
ncbi:N6-adenosine-methyltransferase 70 kDa subunit [Smittium culicis]|uniref:mRNA m(6)A methyltransferase n=1 Tax=Smittium culicis TaxID=133412 RepID=A0A1R1XZ17_9FUNG|nr:N6-adenosine-methyltransferase 70 kDa subunit [Smittium culicis]